MGTKVNSNYEDLLTFTRASKGHALRPVSYGTELVENGTFNTDTTSWTVQNDAVLSLESNALKITNSAANYGQCYQDFSTEVGKLYQLSIDQVSHAGGAASTTDYHFGTPSNKFEYKTNASADATPILFTAVSSTARITLLVGGNTLNANKVFDNISVKEVTFDQPDGTLTLFEHPNNVPRVEWDADRNRLGLLIEEQRVNLFTESEKLSEKDHNLNTTDNSAIAPDRTQTASFCKPTTASAEHYIDDANVTAGTDYAVSCFAKQGPGDYLLAFRGSGIGGDAPQFNLATGTIVNEGASSVWSNTKIENVGNGWYRCSSVGNPNSTTPLRFQIVRSDGVSSFAGDGTSGLYIWGCQIEQASLVTSYMKTTGSTATRSADVASIPVADFGFNTGAGTFVAEFEFTDPENDDHNYVIGSTSQARIMYNNANQSAWQTFDGTAGVTFGNLDNTGASRFKAAVGVKTGSDVATALDGAITGSSTSATSLMENLAGNTLYVGGGSTQSLNGHIKSIQYYPRRLTNAQLQDLTS